MKLDVLKFALAGGIWAGSCGLVMTLGALIGIPGCQEFCQWIASFYGSYGYSITWLGAIIGAFWGFVEGFIHIGIFAWIYNKLTK